MARLILIIISTFIVACGSPSNDDGSATSKGTITPDYDRKVQEFLLAPSYANAVFMGDSIINSCDATLTGDNVNRSIAGATTSDMVYLAYDVIFNEQPRDVYILVGINDKLFGLDVLYSTYMTWLIEILRVYVPNSQIHLISHFANSWRSLDAENEILMGIASRYENVDFIDVRDAFLINGERNTSLYIDGGHLNYDGCSVLLEGVSK